MFAIHPLYWLMLFYGYCLLGWIWESCLVSCRRHHVVNRGFLYGPWLPIYGTGAIVILWMTYPFTIHPLAVFLVGMGSATVLEYVTGSAMEKLFHMRYWDYSHMRFHLNGHICLASSLCWGVFSVGLVYGINPPITNVVERIPLGIAMLISTVWTILFLLDVIFSIRNALDVRKWMDQVMAEHQIFATVKEKVWSISDQIKEESESFRQRVADWPQDASDIKAFLQEQWVNGSKQAWTIICEKATEWKNNRWEQLRKITDMLSEELETRLRIVNEQPKVVEWKQTLQTVKAAIHDSNVTSKTISAKALKKALRMVDAYPHVKSERNQELLDQIKEVTHRHDKK